MIKRISISGFKCIENVSINFYGLTLLTGKNSTGKSSVVHSILALKQDGENPYNGPYIELGDAKELLNYKIGAEEINISALLEGDNELNLTTKYDGSSERNGELLDRLVYCSAERIGVEKIYKQPIQADYTIGGNCEYTFAYLAQHKDDKIDEEYVYDINSLKTFEGQINYWLTKLVGYRVKAESIEQVDAVRVLYQDASVGKNTNWIRPQNIGTGITYIAQILISAFSCSKGDILIIENPEIHLHAEAQSGIMDFFAFLVSCGVQIIIETHSDHIMNGVRLAVKNKLISKEEVQFVYFYKDVQTYEHKCIYPQIDDKGHIDKWPDGFFDEWELSLMELL